MKRRHFLRQSGLAAAASGLEGMLPVAGPFLLRDFAPGKAPADKKISKKWIQSLYERGEPTTYTKSRNEIKFIGMPVGGICCGTVYLGGDGRLWLWDIFNQNQLGAVLKVLPIKLEYFNVNEINNTFGSLYLEPAFNVRPLQQGLALVFEYNGKQVKKRLHADDWKEIIFQATYPVATIRYIEKDFPLEVTLEAFSPFIPGDAFHSGLPVTIQSIRVKNNGPLSIQVDVVGWLENKMLYIAAPSTESCTRINKLMDGRSPQGMSLECTVVKKEWEQAADFGNMGFSSTSTAATLIPAISATQDKYQALIKEYIKIDEQFPVALIVHSHVLAPRQEVVNDFIITWFMPNVSLPNPGDNPSSRIEGSEHPFYVNQFADASAVAAYVIQKYGHLRDQTMRWMSTWYNSTLPWWFLERTFLNISTLATTASHRFKSGRFYAWEGVGCCNGTCTHVYQYAQAMSRIFPELERDTRQRVDLGIGFEAESGMIRYRGEGSGASIDGQAGTILRIYREYLCSADGLILTSHWEKIKKAVEFVIKQDRNGDGMEDTPMENTLDAQWHGEISWIVSLCIASVLAGQKMAEEMQDTAFASVCQSYVEKGRKNMEASLYNGEFFIHRPDPVIGRKEIGSYNTCHIDQVYGQSWAFQVGLGRILDQEKTRSALRALWKYNYMPDVGPYIKNHPGGRFYALAGEGGMVMNTNPLNETMPYGNAKAWQMGYFNECMSGFEYQVAGHMMAEGMVEESLVLTKSIHDRYHAGKRNPFNEIECSDHYGRAMASYGVFINACGFTYCGPKGHIGFAPKMSPANFRAPFTAAEGWGTFSQNSTANQLKAEILVRHGGLRLEKITLELAAGQVVKKHQVTYQGKALSSNFSQSGNGCDIILSGPVALAENEALSIWLA